MCVVGEENKSSLKEWFLSDCVATNSCFLPPHGRTQLSTRSPGQTWPKAGQTQSALLHTLWLCCFSNPHRTLSENCHFGGRKKRQEGSRVCQRETFLVGRTAGSWSLEFCSLWMLWGPASPQPTLALLGKIRGGSCTPSPRPKWHLSQFPLGVHCHSEAARYQ